MTLLNFLSSRETANWCRATDEIGLCILLVSTLLLLSGFGLLFLWCRRPAHSRLYVLKVLFVTVLLCLLIPFAPASKITSFWAVRLPSPGISVQLEVPAFVPILRDDRLPTARRVQTDSSGRLYKFHYPAPSVATDVDWSAVAPPAVNPAAVYEFLTALWAAGMCWQVVRLCRTLVGLRRLVDSSSAVPASSPLGLQFDRHCVSSDLPRPFPLLKTHFDLPSPILVQLPLPGHRAAILIPASYATDLDAVELDAVFSHELGHWRNRDCAWYLLAGLAGAALWPQPLIHVLCHSFKEICEEARDSEVVLNGYSSALYASLLLRLAEKRFASGTSWRSIPATPGILHSHSSLERRIRHVMNQKHMADASRRWMRLPLLTRALVAGGLSFVVVAAVALIDRTPTPGRGTANERHEIIDSAHPKFLMPFADGYPSSGPTPDGIVTDKDILVKDAQFMFADTENEVAARYRAGQVQLIELPELRMRTSDPIEPEKVIWSGPVSKASFRLDTVAAIHTLSDSTGRQIWSDASRNPVPDLQVFRDVDGNVRLLSRVGQVLWSGHLDGNGGGFSGGHIDRSPSPSGQVDGLSRYQFTAATGYMTITGNSGMVKVVDRRGSVLWSGNFPEMPVVYIRDGHEFDLTSRRRSTMGFDQSNRIHFAVEKAMATIENKDHKPLAITPLELLESFKSSEPSPGDDAAGTRRANTWQVGFTPPCRELTVVGTVYVTYRSMEGNALFRSKLYATAGLIRLARLGLLR